MRKDHHVAGKHQFEAIEFSTMGFFKISVYFCSTSKATKEFNSWSLTSKLCNYIDEY